MRDEARLGTRINQNAQISRQNRRQRHTQIQLLQLRTPYAIVDTVQLGGWSWPWKRGYGCYAYGIGIMEIVLTYPNEQMPKILPSASTYAIAYKYLRGMGAN